MEVQPNMPVKNLTKFKRTEITQNIFPDQKIIKIKINYGKWPGKSQTLENWTKLQINARIKGEIENTIYQNYEVMPKLHRGIFIALNVCIKKGKRPIIIQRSIIFFKKLEYNKI